MWATRVAVEKEQGKDWGNSKATLKEQEGWLRDKSTCRASIRLESALADLKIQVWQKLVTPEI